MRRNLGGPERRDQQGDHQHEQSLEEYTKSKWDETRNEYDGAIHGH